MFAYCGCAKCHCACAYTLVTVAASQGEKQEVHVEQLLRDPRWINAAHTEAPF